MKKKYLYILNTFLIVSIALVLFLRFKKTNVEFSCQYGGEPVKLFDIINDQFHTEGIKDWKALFVFNQLPTRSDLASLNKLQEKFKDRLTVLTLFQQKFKTNSLEFRYKYRFIPRIRLYCRNKRIPSGKNFFLLLNGRRLEYLDTQIELTALAPFLNKKLNPLLGYEDFAKPIDTVKKVIKARLVKGNFTLFGLQSNKEKYFKNIDGISSVYFVHASCSSCQLNSLFSKMKLETLLEKAEKSILIFSVFADRFKLKAAATEAGINFPIYIDTNDEFDLFSTITNDSKNPLVIDMNAAGENQS
jgi:hypothetical protein